MDDEVCTEILTAVSEALVKDNHAVQVREELMTLEDFLHEVKGDSAVSKVQKAAFVNGKVALLNYANATEMGEFLKVLGHYLSVVFVAAQILDDSHSQPLEH